MSVGEQVFVNVLFLIVGYLLGAGMFGKQKRRSEILLSVLKDAREQFSDHSNLQVRNIQLLLANKRLKLACLKWYTYFWAKQDYIECVMGICARCGCKLDVANNAICDGCAGSYYDPDFPTHNPAAIKRGKRRK